MKPFKVTFTDGSFYHTEANGTAREFKAYLMQFGGVVVEENPVTGKETRRQIMKVEDLKDQYFDLKERAEWLWQMADEIIDQRHHEGMKPEPDEALMYRLQFQIDDLQEKANQAHKEASVIYNNPQTWQ